jgi:hypothetical protein
MTARWKTFLGTATALALWGSAVSAQEHVGLWGAAEVSRTSLAFQPAAAESRPAVGIRVGTRFPVPGMRALSWLRYGVELAYGATDLFGMDERRDPFAFSHLDVGVQASVHPPSLPRVYAFARWGKRTAERLDAGLLWNYAGGGAAVGSGVEIPITPQGRGLDVGIHRLTGTFTTAERLSTTRDVDLGYRAWMLYLGWSGPLTIALPWQ